MRPKWTNRSLQLLTDPQDQSADKRDGDDQRDTDPMGLDRGGGGVGGGAQTDPLGLTGTGPGASSLSTVRDGWCVVYRWP